MAMVQNDYDTKMIFTMVRNGRYEMTIIRIFNGTGSFRPDYLFAPESELIRHT